MTARPQQARRVKNYLIDARYQITYALPVVAVVAALCMGLGYVASRKAAAATQVGLNHIALLGDSAAPEGGQLREELLSRERGINIGIGVGGVILCIGLLVFGVLLTHRIAGPLLRLRNSLERLRDGSIGAPPGLRKHDMLADIFAAYGGACEALRAREQRELALLRRVLAAAEHVPGIKPEALQALRVRVQVKERALG